MCNHQIDAALSQFTEIRRVGRRSLIDVADDARILTPQPFDNGRKQSGHKYLAAADPELPSGRISQKLDLLYALPNLVKNRDTALEKRPSVERGLDAACAAIEEANSERALQLRNRLGRRRLSETKLTRGFRDAAPLHDGV